MDYLFREFEAAHQELEEVMDAELPRSLRLFNIRFRLALDITIGFEGKVSLTKTKVVRETYSLISKLMETWNAYEALSQYASEIGTYVTPGKVKSRIYSQNLLGKAGSLEILQNSLNWLGQEHRRNSQFRKDFQKYINRVIEAPSIKHQLTKDAKNVNNFLQSGKSISGIEVLSLIYAERNLYYHSGEAAKMGMSYSNRKKLVEEYRRVLIAHTLRLATHMIKGQISDNE